MTETYDLLVLGGGCAGLSLAAKLADGGLAGQRVCVVEARERYERDRTWCSWSVRPHRFESCVTHRWSRWSVRAEGSSIEHASDELCYEHIPADRFYAEALRTIFRTPGLTLELGARVLDLVETDEGVRVRTTKGELRARRVIDTRPPAQRPVGLLQNFTGWHVRTGEDAFDPGVVTLMDFDVSQTFGVHFVYVLPFSEREALVEATFLTPRVVPEVVREASFQGYLERRLGASVERVLWSERGVLPMVAGGARPARSARVLTTGAAAGALKPSTGYAFLNIQRMTDALAAQLLARPDRLPDAEPARGWLDERLDAVFLRFLASHPERAPEVFLRLFRGVEAEPLARFLMEEAGPAERLQVVSAMPKLSFVRAAIQDIVGR